MKTKLVSLIFILLTNAPVWAHTYYEGIIDLIQNPRSGHLEIVHRYTTHDLEIMLSELNQRKLDVESKEFENLLRDYVNEQFYLEKSGKKLPLNWVGIEAGINTIVIYQESAQKESLSGLSIYCAVLSDFFGEQVNRLNYKVNNKTSTLIFDSKNQQKKISVTKSEK